MILVGMLDSPYVRRVAISLKLMGLPFEHRPLSVFRTYEQFRAINPVVKAPTLVVMGTKDPDFSDPAAEARVVAARLGGEVELIEGAGHYPHAEMPDYTASKILDFLRARVTSPSP